MSQAWDKEKFIAKLDIYHLSLFITIDNTCDIADPSNTKDACYIYEPSTWPSSPLFHTKHSVSRQCDCLDEGTIFNKTIKTHIKFFGCNFT